MLAHVLDHVAVADRRADEVEADALQVALKPQVGHDGGDDAVALQPARFAPGASDHAHELVAIDLPALLVHQDQPVGVAVQRDAEVGAIGEHFALEHRRSGGAAAAVDVDAVGLDADRDDFGAQFPQDLGRHLVGGAMGAIDDDLQPVEPQAAREGVLDELDIAAAGVIQAAGAAEGAPA